VSCVLPPQVLCKENQKVCLRGAKKVQLKKMSAKIDPEQVAKYEKRLDAALKVQSSATKRVEKERRNLLRALTGAKDGYVDPIPRKRKEQVPAVGANGVVPVEKKKKAPRGKGKKKGIVLAAPAAATAAAAEHKEEDEE
jgi:hypothetical protein